MPRLTHLAIHVHDMARTIDFYTRYCNLEIIHDRSDAGVRVVWMTESGVDHFMLVFIAGGPPPNGLKSELSHLGYAMTSRDAVTDMAERGERDGCLAWPAKDLPPPVGYFCGLADPDGHIVEFSHGQPENVRSVKESRHA